MFSFDFAVTSKEGTQRKRALRRRVGALGVIDLCRVYVLCIRGCRDRVAEKPIGNSTTRMLYKFRCNKSRFNRGVVRADCGEHKKG